MEILKTVDDLKLFRRFNSEINFVPTMGNLHDGHLHLVERAKCYEGCALVSIFVNPLQFGEGEDFDNYPRTIETDISKLRESNVDALFLPSIDLMYPSSHFAFSVRVPGELGSILCGASRTGHFEGVCTVILKLLNLTKAVRLFMGLKDFQQFTIVKRMIEYLNFDVELVGVDTVRSKEGLALSSRNCYLDQKNLGTAAMLNKALLKLRSDICRKINGDFISQKLKETVRNLESAGFEVEYLEIRNSSNLTENLNRDARIFVAARLSGTRLIDNIPLKIPDINE